MPFVSVIVPVLNAEPWLARCLDSLSRQTVPPEGYEVLVVDNGSSDASREIAARYTRVQRLEESERGSYAARNCGVRTARGALLAFTDPDCVVEPDWLEVIQTAFERPEVALICGLRRPASRSLLVSSVADYESAKDEWVLGSNRAELMYGFTCNLAVRREAFDQLGPFERLRRGADTLLVRKVAAHRTCAAIRFVPQMAVTHLEMTDARAYFRKVHTYGFHRTRNNKRGLGSRPLNAFERLSVLRETVRRGEYSALRSLLLLGALSTGAAFWYLGVLRARVGWRNLPRQPKEPDLISGS